MDRLFGDTTQLATTGAGARLPVSRQGLLGGRCPRASEERQHVGGCSAGARTPVGWVILEARRYVRPAKRIVVHCRKKNGQWGIGVLLSTLSAQDVLLLTEQSLDQAPESTSLLLAYVYYDQGGGGIETANRRQARIGPGQTE